MGEACSKPNRSIPFNSSAESPSSENNLVVIQFRFSHHHPRPELRAPVYHCFNLKYFTSSTCDRAAFLLDSSYACGLYVPGKPSGTSPLYAWFVLIAITRPILIITLFFWLGTRGEGKAGSSVENLRRVTLYGNRYVSLQEWSRTKNFTFDWDRENKIAHVKNGWAKMSFQVGSKRASCNESSLWLCSSVVDWNGALYISERDIYKTLHPILYPEKLPKGKKVKTIVIAAGHGGKDPGNMVNRAQEKTYTLLLAKALKEALVESGFKVIMTRETDRFIDLEPQARIANRAKADLFITVHYNAVADVGPNGIETFCLTPAGAISTNGGSPSERSPGNKHDSFNMTLAYQVHKYMLRNTDFQDRGIRRAGFMVLRHLEMPGILIEGGFMSNKGDAAKIFSASHRRVVARTIRDAILQYKRVVERS